MEGFFVRKNSMRIETGGRPDRNKETKGPGEIRTTGELPPSKTPLLTLFHRKPQTLEQSIAKTPLEGNPEVNDSLLRLIKEYEQVEAGKREQLAKLGVSKKRIQEILSNADKKTHPE
jgi:hypothetical protein